MDFISGLPKTTKGQWHLGYSRSVYQVSLLSVCSSRDYFGPTHQALHQHYGSSSKSFDFHHLRSGHVFCVSLLG